MVQRLQAQLDVDPGSHRVGRADQDADTAGIEVVEQALLVGRPLVVLHVGDLAGRDPEPDEFLLDPAVGRESPLLFHAERAEVREDELPRARLRERRAVGVAIEVLAGLLVDAVDVRDQPVELVFRLIVVAGPDEPHVDGSVPAVGDHREQDVIALLNAARPLLDLRDPLGEDALIIAECLARRSGDELPLPTLQRRQLQRIDAGRPSEPRRRRSGKYRSARGR